jgi:hypothetical protein
VVCLALCGPAAADRPVNQTPETQGIVTSTSIECVGTVTNTASLTWTVSTGAVNSAPLGEQGATATTSYSENTMAVDGYVRYVRDFGVDTSNQVANTNNVESTRIIEFDAAADGNPVGRMISSEDILIDTAGNPASTAENMICPFGSSSSSSIPAFCNIVQAGSDMDVTSVSVATEASSRTVAASADIPVALSYHIKATGLAGNPAEGSISAYIRSHIMEGRGDSLNKAGDLIYKEQSTASGEITLFDKLMEYQSGMRRF